jgi:DNA-binding beta-propeller fold protein YncE
VGNAGFSAGEVDYTSLAFNGSGGQPYVAYVDYANSQKATVMKYDFPTGFNELQHSPLSFYPNPASTTLTVVTTSTGSLLILNANGQSQLQQEITNPITTIDVSTLANGVYVVKVFGEKGVEVGKFIKQ